VEPGEEQARFAAAIHAFSRRECGTVAQRDAQTEGGTLSSSLRILAALAELGWLGVSLPAEYGGSGFVDGYAREYGMEGQVRRALAPPIYGGTNEIQREIIAKSLL
jgi:alkylation response protein AidB-like acyl-CoA dehydrogenase